MADPLSSECGPAQEPAPEYRGSVNYRIPQAVKAISYFGQQWGSTLFLKSMWQNGAISLRPEGVAHEKKGRFSFPRVGECSQPANFRLQATPLPLRDFRPMVG
jgi:hypothetical protein